MKAVKKNMMIGEAISINPNAADVLLEKGIGCIGCGGVSFETLEQGLKAHGMSNKEIDKLVNEINKPRIISITSRAEMELADVMKKKGYKYLRIDGKEKKLKLIMEKARKKNDKEIAEKGIKVIFDKKYSKSINEKLIDYLAEEGGFLIK